MEPAHLIMLGGIQARIELGPYNAHTHTISWFRYIVLIYQKMRENVAINFKKLFL